MVLRYLEGEKPLPEDDVSWIYDKEDLVAVRPVRERAELDTSIERMLRRMIKSNIGRVSSALYSLHVCDLREVVYFSCSSMWLICI